MKYLSVFLCLRYLGSRKIVFLSIAAVGMCSALLIVVASLFTGFIQAFETGASDHMGDVIIQSPYQAKIEQYDDLINVMESHPDIQAATAVLSGQGLMLLGKGNVRPVRVQGIELAKRNQMMPVKDSLLRQKNDPSQIDFAYEDIDAESAGIVSIGVVAQPDEKTDEYDIDAIMQEFVGQKVLLTTGRAIKVDGEGGNTQSRPKRTTIKFTITDVVFTGVYEMDRHYVYLPIEVLSKKLYPDMDPVADTIQIRLAPGVAPASGKATANRLWREWASKTNRPGFVNVTTAQELQADILAEYYKQMQILMTIFGIVSAGAILLVFCVFYLIVVTKQKDIAIIKSCGMGSSAVAGLYMTFGLVIGIAGAAVGVLLGWYITTNINAVEQWINTAFGLKIWKSSTYMFSRIPSRVDWDSVVWISMAAIVAAAVGALIPAITAAMVKPVRILRYE